VRVCVRLCVYGWVGRCVGVCVGGCMCGWVYVWVGVCAHRPVITFDWYVYVPTGIHTIHILGDVHMIEDIWSMHLHICSIQTRGDSTSYKTDDTGWRRCIGCLKLQVFFRKRATNHRALSRKMTSKDKTYDTYAAKGPLNIGLFRGKWPLNLQKSH